MPKSRKYQSQLEVVYKDWHAAQCFIDIGRYSIAFNEDDEVALTISILRPEGNFHSTVWKGQSKTREVTLRCETYSNYIKLFYQETQYKCLLHLELTFIYLEQTQKVLDILAEPVP